MTHPDMLFINCKNCGEKIPTSFVISRESTGTVLQNNVCGPCPKCSKSSSWSDYEAFYDDGTPFKSR